MRKHHFILYWATTHCLTLYKRVKKDTTFDVIPQLSAALYHAVVM